MHCARSIKKTNVVYPYARHIGLIDRGMGLSASYIYINICIILDLAIKLMWCTGMQGIYAQ